MNRITVVIALIACFLGTPLFAQSSVFDLSTSNITTSTVDLSWNFSGNDAVRYDYIVVESGTTPDSNSMPTGTLAFGPVEYSDLWGEDGDLWDPSGPLPDITDVGYMKGEEAIPDANDWPIGENVVTDHGAVGDGIHDDTQALKDAIAACAPEHAVYLPKGIYKITDQIIVDKNYIVIRGEDMYETILKFPEGLRDAVGDPDANYTNGDGFIKLNGNISIFNLSGDTTHRSIENLTFEFPEIESEGHFSSYGANAIQVGSVRDSWFRNILIKNCDNGIIMNGSVYVSIINIEFDNYPGRVAKSAASGDNGYVGHNGIKPTGKFNLVHNVTFRGPDEYEHTIAFNNTSQNTVISRIRGSDLQLDDHGGATESNYFTEINLGEGTPEVGRPTYRGANEYSVWWNIAASTDQTYESPDPTDTSVIVGLRTIEPSVLTETAYWRESKTPELLYPQNIYLAQLEKLGKPMIDSQLTPGGATAIENSATVRGLSENTDYDIYVRNSPLTGLPGDWSPVATFKTSSVIDNPPSAPTGLSATRL